MQPDQIVNITYRNKPHWFKVHRFETEQAFRAALTADRITRQPAEIVSYTNLASDGEECGRMYLLDKSIKTLATEATKMAINILTLNGYAPTDKLEEELSYLTGVITSELYSQSKYY